MAAECNSYLTVAGVIIWLQNISRDFEGILCIMQSDKIELWFWHVSFNETHLSHVSEPVIPNECVLNSHEV